MATLPSSFVTSAARQPPPPFSVILPLRDFSVSPHGVTSLGRGVWFQRRDASEINLMKDFYTSTAWKAKRAAILCRDGYMCKRCKRYGRQRQATTVHHIKHYDEYPELALDNDNLISLCDKCHNYYHPEKAEKANKRIKRSYY